MRVALFACLLCMFGMAHATLITIDPDNFAPGEDISNATPGVTLSTYSKDWTDLSTSHFSPIRAVFCDQCSTGAFNGENVFGTNAGNPTFIDAAHVLPDREFEEPYVAFRADFTNPTNYVQILGGAFGPGNTELGLFAFDSEDNLIGSCVSGGEDLPSTPGCDLLLGLPTPGRDPALYDPWALTVNTATFNISYVIAGGLLNGQVVKSMSFVSVPEPSSWALMALGVILILVVQRKRISGEKTSSDSLSS